MLKKQLIQLYDALPQNEKNVFEKRGDPLTPAIDAYIESVVGNRFNRHVFDDLPKLKKDMEKKQAELVKKKEREEKKKAVTVAKTQAAASLNRTDIANTIRSLTDRKSVV